MRRTNGSGRAEVVVAGGGVAALEAMLALHDIAGRQVRLTLMAPGTEFLNRPASVAAPFGLGGPGRVPYAQVARQCNAELRSGMLAAVAPDEQVLVTGDAERVPYDVLLVAVGARAALGVPGAQVFAGPQDVPMLTAALDAVERGELRSLLFGATPGVAWTLPLYELAIMAAVDLRDRGAAGASITVVTPEEQPLHLFGAEASDAVGELLRARGIRLVHGRIQAIQDGTATLADGTTVAADRAIVLPPLQGPWIEGLRHDEHGFIPVDMHGRVAGADAVYAAGDATAFPVKQGGLATQQADAAAAAIAADLGLRADPPPFRPVLRGLLLTGGAPLYLRAELHKGGTSGSRRVAMRGDVSTRALWWPPGKVAGRYLAPFLATARPLAIGREPLVDRVASGYRPADPEADEALALALLLADEDARAGDLTQALHALDAAAALRGGVLPADAAAKRDAWRAELDRKSTRQEIP
jgi:sulfide:quinone oxidoreductase